ncbi:MAG: transposase [Candidatus Omnitrophica bacterium]|nr:transposase [Candidatus Omnitrophota bacterium]
MPRKPREFVDGGIYHIFNRGNDRRKIFLDNKDFECFLNMAGCALEKYPIEIFHYCLMPNHFHFLLKSRAKEGLPAFMHWLQLGYVRYFKKKYETTGHVFEERFKCPRIAEESYYLQCGRYIERNPVKAEMASQAWDYPYSSAAYYAEGREDRLITSNLYYFEMGLHNKDRQQNYKKFLLIEDPYVPMIDTQLMTY